MFTSVLVIAALAAAVPFQPAVARPGCRAAVEIANDLWVASSKGDLGARLTSDGRKKGAASWSPNGRSVVFASRPARHGDTPHIFVTGSDGGEVRDMSAEAAEQLRGVRELTRLDWPREGLLVSYGKVGRQGGYVDFWEVSASAGVIGLAKRVEVAGGRCVLSPGHELVACVISQEQSDSIAFFDTSKKDSAGKTFFDEDYFVHRGLRGRLEGPLAWSDGVQLLAVVRGEAQRSLVVLRRSGGGPEWEEHRWPLDLLNEQVVGVATSEHGKSALIKSEKRAYEVSLATGEALDIYPMDHPVAGRLLQTQLAVKLDGGRMWGEVLGWTCDSR